MELSEFTSYVYANEKNNAEYATFAFVYQYPK